MVRDYSRRVVPKRRVAIVACSLLSVVLATAAAVAPSGSAAESGESDGLALTPPMSWNSWGHFRQFIDEEIIRAQIDAMVESGVKDAGYEYFIIDGGWQPDHRDANGNLHADPARFPSGIEAIVDYVHSKGLKFGIHVPAGMTDCRGVSPGTQSAPGDTWAEKARHDAETLVGFGIDYLKWDRCRFEFPEGTVPGAPDVDKITVRSSTEIVATSEAEDDGNTMLGAARRESCELCSGEEMVEAIGIADGAIEFVDVAVPAAGEYKIDLSFVHVNRGLQDRSWATELYAASVAVNGGGSQQLRYDAVRQADGTVFTLTVTAQLDAGSNTIVVSNPNNEEEALRQAYVEMSEALKEMGRPVVLNLSGVSRPWLWGRGVGHLGRANFDFLPIWDYGVEGQLTPAAIANAIDLNAPLAEHNGPGYWNNPGQLQIGLEADDPGGHDPLERFPVGLTTEEQRTQFSMWAMLTVPLTTTVDLTEMSATTKEILTNERVIAIDQDPLGVPGERVRVDPGELVPFPWTASADSVSGANVPANAVDWNFGTAWVSANTPMPHWIELDVRPEVADDVEVSKVVVRRQGVPLDRSIIHDLDVATSTDSGPLTVQASVRDNQDATVTVELASPVPADKIRLTIHRQSFDGAPAQIARLSEIEVYDAQGQRIPFSHPLAKKDREVWAKPLANGDRAVALFNRSDSAVTMSTTAQEIGLPAAPLYLARDLWTNRLQPTRDEISALVPAHGVVMFRVEVRGGASRSSGEE